MKANMILRSLEGRIKRWERDWMHGKLTECWVWCGVVWCGVVWCGVVWCWGVGRCVRGCLTGWVGRA